MAINAIDILNVMVLGVSGEKITETVNREKSRMGISFLMDFI